MDCTNSKWRLFEAVSLGLNLGLAINLFLLFFYAIIKGKSEMVVTFNDFGERDIEMVVFPIIILMGAITLVRMARRR